jgi:hypothetical protein
MFHATVCVTVGFYRLFGCCPGTYVSASASFALAWWYGGTYHTTLQPDTPSKTIINVFICVDVCGRNPNTPRQNDWFRRKFLPFTLGP